MRTPEQQISELQSNNTALVEENRRLRAALKAANDTIIGATLEPYGADTRRSDVTRFHADVCKVEIGSSPHVPSDAIVRARALLIAEEFFELLDSLWSGKDMVDCGVAIELAERAHWDVRRAIERPLSVDLPALTDATIDLDYTVEGLRVSCGIDGRPLWRLVHAANMAKEGGHIDGNGKLRKPHGWAPPDVYGELVRQGWVDR